MLRERIESLLAQWRQCMAGGWDDHAMAQILRTLGELGSAAGKFRIEAPALAARDAAAYLGFLIDSASSPDCAAVVRSIPRGGVNSGAVVKASR